MDARKALVELRQDWIECKRCPLQKCRTNKNIVFGAGSIDPDFFLLYDVPSEGDDESASPMSGDEGSLLLDLMKQAGIAQGVSYVSPIVGCRSTITLPATADAPMRIAPRIPTKEELQACRPRVDTQIYTVDPRLIFTLGKISYASLVKGKDREGHNTLEQAMGTIKTARIRGAMLKEITYPVIPLLSMQQLIASPSMSRTGPLAATIKYMRQGRLYVEALRKDDRKTHEAGQGKAPP